MQSTWSYGGRCEAPGCSTAWGTEVVRGAPSIYAVQHIFTHILWILECGLRGTYCFASVKLVAGEILRGGSHLPQHGMGSMTCPLYISAIYLSVLSHLHAQDMSTIYLHYLSICFSTFLCTRHVYYLSPPSIHAFQHIIMHGRSTIYLCVLAPLHTCTLDY